MFKFNIRVVLQGRCISRYRFSTIPYSTSISPTKTSRMPSSDDEFSAFDFSEFTEDDLKQIDAGLVPPNPKSSPKIVVELETSPERPEGTPKSVTSSKQPTEKSPYQQHRHRGVLSVTDLASLAWFVCSYLKRRYIARTDCRRCEVQFDYGLRQRRSRPIASRPESFVSAQGKEILVEKSVAVKNDHITKQGKVSIVVTRSPHSC
jgi:exonuclease V